MFPFIFLETIHNFSRYSILLIKGKEFGLLKIIFQVIIGTTWDTFSNRTHYIVAKHLLKALAIGMLSFRI